MTLATSTARADYAGDTVSTVFAVPFYFLDNTHLEVVKRDAAGTETVLVKDVHYTVAGAAVPAGGSVTMLTAPASGEQLTIRRNVPITQTLDYVANDPFPAESHERGLDKGAMIDQQQAEEISRGLRAPVSDLAMALLPNAAARAGKFLAFGAGGAPVAIDADATPPFMLDFAAQITDEAARLAEIRDKLSINVAYWWPSVAEMVADTALKYAPGAPGDNKLVFVGDYVEAGGFRYEIAAADATGTLLDGPNGIKLLPLPTPGGYYSPLMFGASTSASASTNFAAFEACRDMIVATGLSQFVPGGTYDFVDTLSYPGGTTTHWDSVVMLMQFDGVGIEFGSNATYANIYGFLRVQKGEGGSGPVPNDGNYATGPGTASGDHALLFKGRVNQIGCVDGMYTHDSAIVFEATANANHSRFSQVRGFRSGKHGIECKGTQNDNSLWSIYTSSYGNWESGFHAADDYFMRSWIGLIHCEQNCKQGSGVEFYAGKATLINGLGIYAENPTGGINEIEFGPNCEWVNYYDYRNNKTVLNSTRSETICNISNRTGLASPVLSYHRATWINPSNPDRYARLGAVETSISGVNTLMQEWRVKGDRTTYVGNVSGTPTEIFDLRHDGNVGLLGSGKGYRLVSPNGSVVRFLTIDNSGAIVLATGAP